jgi:hypothetical protein
MNARLAYIGAALLLLVGAAAGCSKKSKGGPTGPGTGTVRVVATDAPAVLNAVNLVIRQVACQRAGVTDTTAGWEVLSNDSMKVNLLSLRNGTFVTLAAGQVPPGHYTQLRILVGSSSTVVSDSATFALTMAASDGAITDSSSGGFDVSAGGTTEVGIDFQVAQSVQEVTPGVWLLTPKIRVMQTNKAGAITGTCTPPTGATVYAIGAAADTVNSTVPEANGRFALALLPAGNYTVLFRSTAVGARDTSVTATVTAGATATVGTVTIPH